ncbi:MAG: TetR/AcrR family transcriptional regulator [Spirochaetaceae bacterium]|nr:TetR/AcrR family transcriptional regulator [Spirochaetaceae bacterium]
MSESAEETKLKIIESAKKEFLENGFTNASLRTIAANAGVTTGAMYRHFKDKYSLFCALVDDAIDAATKAVMLADVSNHLDLDNVVSKEHFAEETRQTNELVNYIFDNFDAFTLLLTKAAGSTHEHFQEEICDLHTKNCEETFNWMYKNGITKKKIDKMTVHFIASTIINAFVEIITHKMTKKAAFQYIANIEEFTRSGMLHMMGIPCN